MRGLALLLVLVPVLACSGSDKKPTTPSSATVRLTLPDGGVRDGGPDEHIPRLSGPARMIDDRYFVDEGAPDPRACAADKDCIGDSVPDDTGCCVRSQEAFAQTWAWHTWIVDRRLTGSCAKVSCPPVPPPAMPEMCRLKVRCQSRVCVDSCSEQPDQKQDQRGDQAPQK
jgi:hypothetical protein